MQALFRAAAGMFIGVMITACALPTVPAVLVISWILMAFGLPEYKDPRKWMTVTFNWLIKQICYEMVLGCKINVEHQFLEDRPLGEHELRIVFGNHPSNVEFLPYFWAVPAVLGPDLVIVGASRHKWHVMGIAWWLLRIVWMIDRSNTASALATISRKLSAVIASRRGNLIVGIFPQSTRTTYAKWIESKAAVKAKAQRWADHGKYALAKRLLAIAERSVAVIPRSGGAELIFKGILQSNVHARYFIVGVRSPAHIGTGFFTLPMVVGKSIDVRIEEVTNLPEDSDEFYLWLCHQIGQLEEWANTVDPIQHHAPH